MSGCQQTGEGMVIWHSFVGFHSDSGQGEEGLNPTVEMSANITLGTPGTHACQGEGLFC